MYMCVVFTFTYTYYVMLCMLVLRHIFKHNIGFGYRGHYCQEVMQCNCGYGYLCIEADNAESDTEVKKVIYTVKSHGATNTLKVEIQKVEGEKLKVITLDKHLGTLSVFTLKNGMT